MLPIDRSAEVQLDLPQVAPSISEREAARVLERVRVDERQPARRTDAAQTSLEPRPAPAATATRASCQRRASIRTRFSKVEVVAVGDLDHVVEPRFDHRGADAIVGGGELRLIRCAAGFRPRRGPGEVVGA